MLDKNKELQSIAILYFVIIVIGALLQLIYGLITKSTTLIFFRMIFVNSLILTLCMLMVLGLTLFIDIDSIYNGCKEIWTEAMTANIVLVGCNIGDCIVNNTDITTIDKVSTSCIIVILSFIYGAFSLMLHSIVSAIRKNGDNK